MKRLFAIILLACIGSTYAAPRNSWLRQMPNDLRPSGTLLPLADDQFAEIPASKLQSAKERLEEAAISELKEDFEVTAFAPRGFSCKYGERAFLVRALYEYGHRGHWELFLIGPNLLVRNAALGPPSEANKSALVLCLKAMPVDVYVEVYGAM